MNVAPLPIARLTATPFGPVALIVPVLRTSPFSVPIAKRMAFETAVASPLFSMSPLNVPATIEMPVSAPPPAILPLLMKLAKTVSAVRAKPVAPPVILPAAALMMSTGSSSLPQVSTLMSTPVPVPPSILPLFRNLPTTCSK